MHARAHVLSSRAGFIRDAVLTCLAVLLTYAALDDIATDNARTFVVERIALIVCGCWFLFVGSRLWRQGYRRLGGLSIVAAIIAPISQAAFQKGIVPSLRPEYVLTFATLAWFAVLCAILVWMAVHMKEHAAL